MSKVEEMQTPGKYKNKKYDPPSKHRITKKILTRKQWEKKQDC